MAHLRLRLSRLAQAIAISILIMPISLFAQTSSDPGVSELWDFTSSYDPASLSHFAKALSDDDRGRIITIINRFTGSRGKVVITSSVQGSFTGSTDQQTLVYASQYDDRRSMSDGTWNFYILFSKGHAEVINGGTSSVRGERFLLRSVHDPKADLDKILVYSGWFGMREDIGSAYLMSIHDLKPTVDVPLGTVYESTCGSGFPQPATVASKIYRVGPTSFGIVRENYVRDCGSAKFKYLRTSTEEAGDVLSSLASSPTRR